MAKKEVDVDVGNGGGGGMSTGKLVIILVVAQVVLIGGLVAALWFAGVFGGGSGGGDEGSAEAEQAEQSQEPHYVKMGDPFTVNISGGNARFMQVGIQFMSHDSKAGEAVKTHMPVIRDRINTILGAQNAEEVRTTEGKQQLRKQILEDMRKVLEERYGKPAIEEVYFTKFVIQ